jgi:D-3-phosphoglycerate dehydrogenase
MKPSILIAEPHGFTPEAYRVLQIAANVWCATITRNGMSEAMRHYDAIWVRLGHRITAATIPADCKCRLIATPCTGLDHIDVDACRARGIEVVSLKGETEFLSDVHATAEHTLALTLALLRKLVPAVNGAGDWQRDRYCGRELYGKTVGIIGYGRIGKQVCRLFNAFGTHAFTSDCGAWDHLLRASDVVTLHVPFNASTRHIMGANELALMKPTAVLINTSRGGVIDEKALADALENERIAGAALDVLDGEPPDFNHPLLKLARTTDRVIVTPHIGGKTHESCEKTEVFLANKVVSRLRMTPNEDGIDPVDFDDMEIETVL